MRSSGSASAVSMTTGRSGQLVAHPAAHLEPVDPGQHEVEHDRGRAVGSASAASAGCPSPTWRVRVPGALEIADDDRGDRRVVVDHHHLGHGAIVGSGVRHRSPRSGGRVTAP